jgi:hypothetical protein
MHLRLPLCGSLHVAASEVLRDIDEHHLTSEPGRVCRLNASNRTWNGDDAQSA